LIKLPIKSRSEILTDIIRNGKKHPKNWKAVVGQDRQRLSKDFYIFNPNIGIYLMKEYQKNPYEVKGVGSKIARQVDEGIEADISKHSGDFGILQGDFRKILKNLEKGIKPEKIFNSAISGKNDYGVKIPVRGRASSSKPVFDSVHNEMKQKRKKLDSKFEELAKKDGLYKGYD
jgi:hypothetical protein